MRMGDKGNRTARRSKTDTLNARKRSRFLENLDLGGVRRSALVARTVSQARQLPLFGVEEPTR